MVDRRPKLEGKVAIVTGAGAVQPEPPVGTGQAISVCLAREGARVLLVDRVAQRAEQTLATIKEEGGEASVLVGDVTSAQDCRAMAEAAMERYGGLHVLVNNVGILVEQCSVIDVEEEVWDRVLSVNLKGMMLTSKYALPKMIEGGGGSVINISSIGGLRGARYVQVHYSTSKAGVIGLTTTMAAQHARENVRVNCITPGDIHTPMASGKATEEQRRTRAKRNPLGTEGTAWDIGWAAVFLAGDEARWITGIVLPVDGGGLITLPGEVSPENW